MKQCLIVLIALFLCCTPRLLLAQEESTTELWTTTKPGPHHESIVKVSLDGAIGTGVVVHVDRQRQSGDGYLGHCLTAFHVVENDNGRNAIRVAFRNGRVAHNCKIMHSNKELDVATIWAWIPPDIPAASLAHRRARTGDRIELTGLGDGSKLNCCVRHFRGIASDPTNKDQIFADVSLLPGDSGGPVFDKSGHLTGIISGGWFWWHDDRLTRVTETNPNATWPARASNLAAIRTLVQKSTNCPSGNCSGAPETAVAMEEVGLEPIAQRTEIEIESFMNR